MMSQTLLTLAIVVLLLPIEIMALRVLVKHQFFEASMQDEIGLAQMRQVLNVCYEKEVLGNSLACIYKNERIEFVCNGRFLYATPGTWIFLTEIDEVYFEDDGKVRMEYWRKGKTRKVTLSYE